MEFVGSTLEFSGGIFACFWGQFGSEVAPNMEPRTSKNMSLEDD